MSPESLPAIHLSSVTSPLPFPFLHDRCSYKPLPCSKNARSRIITHPIKNSRHPFVEMPDRLYSASSWSSLILARTRAGDCSQAFLFCSEMMKSGFEVDEFVLGGLLEASCRLADISIGEQLHARSICSGLASESSVRASLIAMYSSCGLLVRARQVFDEVTPFDEGDGPSWNSIISAYVFHGQYYESFRLFSDMHLVAELWPTDATYVSLICACAAIEDIEIGERIHAMIIKDGTPDEKTKLMNSLITMYAKGGHLQCANKVFEAMDGTDIVSWNAVIAGHEQNGDYKQALKLCRNLTRLEAKVRANRITFLSILSAISGCSALKLGKEVHAQVIKSRVECETSIGNSIITMYGKCGEIGKCRLVFERLPHQDVITWNSMLMGYAENNQTEGCCKLFREMILSGIKPDDHTITILLGKLQSDPSSSDFLSLNREIHGYLLRKPGFRTPNIAAYNAVMAMYAKCGMLKDAEELFKWMNKRDLYSWNAMIDGYSSNGYYDDAIELFIDMQEQGLESDHLTLSILLTACGRLASAELGKQIHAFAIKHWPDHRNREASLLSVNNALVSMYSKCGSISDAVKAFHRMPRKDVFSWTAMITGYAHHGMAFEAFDYLGGMKRDGIEPNSITFLGLLTACAHAGLLKEGTECFSSMRKDYGIEPGMEHYACMVDLYGRFGQFERAKDMVGTGISQLALKQDSRVCLWKVLLGACHAHKQLELGVQAATKILEIDPTDETCHVLLSNLYASFGLWEDANSIRSLMKEKGLKKEVGSSWVEIDSKRHVFVAGDSIHPEKKDIQKTRALG